MKLMTELVDGCVHAMGYCVDTEDVKPLEVARLENDALAAHALMQAIQNRIQAAQDSRDTSKEAMLNGAMRYADELMAKWTKP